MKGVFVLASKVYGLIVVCIVAGTYVQVTTQVL